MQSIISMIKVRAVRASLVGILLVLSAALPTAASAHYYGGSWAYSGGNRLLMLSYQNLAGAYPSYSQAIDQAARNWYATPTPSYLYSTASPANITANTYSDSTTTVLGITHIYARHQVCSTFLCSFTTAEVPGGAYPTVTPLSRDWSNYISATIGLNRGKIDTYQINDFIKVGVATHEFGHAQGLGHPFSPSCTNSVMWTTGLFPSTIITPQPHDLYDFNSLYPNLLYPQWAATYAC